MTYTFSTLIDLASKIPPSIDPELWLEKNFGDYGTSNLRGSVAINDNREPLVSISKESFNFYSPHHYVSQGAPYGKHNPFTVRLGVHNRLQEARAALNSEFPGYRLKIFDGFRPLDVQQFLFNEYIRKLAREKGFDPDSLSAADYGSFENIALQLFAKPGRDPKCPPGHSTGGAVDLTIVDDEGVELLMGTNIDDAGPEIYPSYFESDEIRRRHGEIASTYSRNRALLKRVMQAAGFERLFREWWHFSYGDQYWAVMQTLRRGTYVSAFYGAIELAEKYS